MLRYDLILSNILIRFNLYMDRKLDGLYVKDKVLNLKRILPVNK